MHGTYVGNGRILVTTTFGAKLLVPSDDLSLMPDLVASGGYDEPFTNFVRHSLGAGAVAVDVGANIGLFTLLMAWQTGPTGQVVSYECEPRNFEVLRENVAMNYASWVELHDAAVGDHAGQIALHRTSRFRGNASTVPHDDRYTELFRGLDTVDVVEVPLVSLDDSIGRFERIDLVKVDVEGAELQVLRGMRRLLGERAVRQLSIEIGRDRMPAADWDALGQELRHLGAAGWDFATIAPDGTSATIDLDAVLARGTFSQLLVTSA